MPDFVLGLALGAKGMFLLIVALWILESLM